MATLDASWSTSLRQIGALERPDHCRLPEAASIFFLGEYTPRAGFGHSKTNQLISNLKKTLDKRNTSQWRHKGRAIAEIAATLSGALNHQRLSGITIVPIPPSKLSTDPLYDDRMVKIANLLPSAGTRELIQTVVEREPRHIDNNARDPDELRATLNYVNDGGDTPSEILLLDDVITTGCSFIVCQQMLAEVYPNSLIGGLFVSRRVLPNPIPVMNIDDIF